MEVFHLYDSAGKELHPSPVEFYFNGVVSTYSRLTENEQIVYDELWSAAEAGEPLSEDLMFGDMNIKADRVTWKLKETL